MPPPRFLESSGFCSPSSTLLLPPLPDCIHSIVTNTVDGNRNHNSNRGAIMKQIPSQPTSSLWLWRKGGVWWDGVKIIALPLWSWPFGLICSLPACSALQNSTERLFFWRVISPTTTKIQKKVQEKKENQSRSGSSMFPMCLSEQGFEGGCN